MLIKMMMQPEVPPMSFKQFCKMAAPFSVAFDGYVSEGPCFNPKGPWVNFNHHEQVDRLATRSTCAQFLMAIRQGFFGCFSEGGNPHVVAYFNDCDEDVCLTWFLAKYGWMAEHVVNPNLNRLVHMEDMLDATAGAYPFPASMPMLGKIAWVFEPYRRARVGGELDRKNPETYISIVGDVERRIMQHITGDGGEIQLDTTFLVISAGQGWSLVEETGAHARTGMFSQGIKAFVSVRQRPSGNFTYTVGRMSPFIPFDVPKIISALNEVEGLTGEADRWGGGDTIGGGPRVSGSKLSPDQVREVVEEVLSSK